jgi:flavin-dependent dehydrogenase
VYDVIVVGARCAGATTALLFARRGYRVLLIDRAVFPRDTLSTLYIQQPGVAKLAGWGLLDRVAASGCPPLDHVTYDVDGVRLAGCSRPVDGIGSAYAPRRDVLDPILAAAAVEAGVEFRAGCAFEDVVWSGDRVVGVRHRSPGGGSVTERATLVVGADGRRSPVAAKVGAATLVEDPPRTCVYYTYWAGVSDHFELYETTGQWVGAVPTNGGATLVQAYFPQSSFDRVRADAMTAYLENVRTVAPDLYDRMLAGGRLDRLYGTGDQQNFFRTAAGPGWALVGDAGHHKDSITARGITHAFLQAQLLTDLIGDGLADEPRRARALAEFGRQRDDALIDEYRDTLAVAKLSTPPYRVSMLRDIAADPARTERFLSRMSGALRPGEARDELSLADAIRWMKARRGEDRHNFRKVVASRGC